MEHHETPLTQVSGLSDPVVRRLTEHWITSAEQLVGLASTEGGLQSLARALGVGDEAAQQVVERARLALDPATAADLSRPADTSRFGLGARRPEGPADGR